MWWFPRILKFERLLEYNSMEQWLTLIQTYAVLFKKNWKLLETKYSVVIVWRIGWWHQYMQINCSHVSYYCHCMFHAHPPSCLVVCLLNKWTKRPSLITILDTVYCLTCSMFRLVCKPTCRSLDKKKCTIYLWQFLCSSVRSIRNLSWMVCCTPQPL
jgi:hypothetical protein